MVYVRKLGSGWHFCLAPVARPGAANASSSGFGGMAITFNFFATLFNGSS
jgi:hypothetical protein